MEKRLQKIISEMGVTSRRKAEDLITEGRITVNGRTAALGMKADPTKDHIKLDGKLLLQQTKVYLLFHKPKHVVTSLNDPEGRKTVKDFLKGIKYRVFPIGRLDYDSEGLLLLTNDGDFAHALLHPSREIYKTYHVKVRGSLELKEIAQLQSGIRLREGVTAPAKVKRLKKTEQNSWLEISIHEGKNRQVRKMLEKVSHPVLKLKRIRINGIELGNLSPGRYRYLTHDEIRKIKREVTVQRTH